MNRTPGWNLDGRLYLVLGVANRRSVAYHVGNRLEQLGARCVYGVHTHERLEGVRKLLPDAEIHVCDVTDDQQIENLYRALAEREYRFDGMLHSIAYADYRSASGAFHQTDRQAFFHAMDVSCFSLIRLSDALRPLFKPDASVVTISISTTRMAAQNYGYMAPIKAALDSSLAFLTQSFSRFSEVRFNAVGAGLLKTSSSAGIPGYVDAYLYAEQVIPRRRALQTEEVANVAVFLLSPWSSGIAAQTIVVDAGLSINFFDPAIIQRVLALEPSQGQDAS
ncbi:MAG: enoyl-[acyl-carrier-protein] reductase [NADH] [Pirellulaceae bacterium]|nr:MAG: enoyl-[acyl-carrier-protein] reductase [NADH] [Pirellulaceae bacterium]GIW95919.1 MAG: enoyl-[acyl-carrier-protein] reductase [NADH] [Pirellulaceae bacterium]